MWEESQRLLHLGGDGVAELGKRSGLNPGVQGTDAKSAAEVGTGQMTVAPLTSE